MTGRAQSTGGFWLAGALVFSAAFLGLFRIVPWALNRAEPFYLPPVFLPTGKIVLRSDTMGDGYFGASRSNNRTHNGIDIAAPVGDPVYASRSGRVAHAGPKGGYGNLVELLHPDGLDTRYAHLSEIDVSFGEWVGAGRMIGRVGKTGNAGSPQIAPHLHFEVRRGDTPLNPINWMEPGRETA